MIETRGRILVVDDEPLVLETIEAALKEEGYEVYSSSTSNHAISQLDKNKFDAIVCDVKLDELGGFEVINFAKKKQQNIKSILITGAPNAEDLDRARLLNAEYFVKPISLVKLVETIESSVKTLTLCLAEIIANYN